MFTVRATKIFLPVSLAVACFGLMASSPAARGAEPGVVPDVTWGTSPGEVELTVSRMQEAGVKWARLNVSWASLEPDAKGGFSSGYLHEMDLAVERVRAAGIQVVMPLSDSVPYWASADPSKSTSGGTASWNKYYRPANMNDYGDAFRFLAQHFSAEGVHVYEVWNEPNHPRFWPSGPNPAEYVQMLRAAYPAIKQADPGATVLSGGLAQNDRQFMEGIYANGGGSYFDAVADHVYPKTDPESCRKNASGGTSRDDLCGIENIRQVMVANGDSAKQVWITEMGYATCLNTAPNCWNMGVSEADQAKYLKETYLRLEEYPWIAVALWYNFRNTYWLNNDPGDFEATTGLLRSDFSEKPAYAAFREYASGTLTRPQSSIPDPTSTVVKVERHGSNVRPKGGHPVRVSRRGGAPAGARVVGRVRGATSGVVKIEVEHRGHRDWRGVISRSAPVRRSGQFTEIIGRQALLRSGVGRPTGRRDSGSKKSWRVRARYLGGGGNPGSVSRYRYFRVG